ncbi:hypothetical protein NQ176_g5781 [Zarea fungicola]|uniref:Uncharacterized protein n=1 Tax=Zarea fungicola TaxID=93591 RepID=A0ACC1N909_9HYPO|nr:hypothetical protein NQ176_g5781 [Lecanicillium fungicola]
MRPPLSRLFPRSWYNRIQVLSDIHLEVGQQYTSFTFPATAPYLLLAGDVGRLLDYDSYLAFLKKQILRYENVFLVLGNHEFYGMSYSAALESAQRLTEEPSLAQRLVLLSRTRWDSPRSNLSILGCTMWSLVPDERIDIVQSKINDFQKIEGWTVASHNQVHTQEATWLRDQVAGLAQSKDLDSRSLLVATHHAPCIEGSSRPEHAESPWSSAFATEMLASGGWDPVKTWVFGHTHHSTDMVRNGIRVVANQRGYVVPSTGSGKSMSRKSAMPTSFDATKVITVE